MVGGISWVSAAYPCKGQPLTTIVSNTIPLIALGKIGVLDTIGQFYASVRIPPAAFYEENTLVRRRFSWLN